MRQLGVSCVSTVLHPTAETVLDGSAHSQFRLSRQPLSTFSSHAHQAAHFPVPASVQPAALVVAKVTYEACKSLRALGLFFKDLYPY